MFSHANKILVDHGVGAPLHGKYDVDCLNGTDKICIIMLMTTVQIPGAANNNL